ncbi:hypothetical protein ACFXG1_04860 [Streptomyces sp. NPDC059248]|uniref:hypothetical protein n=1 Tax=Streptomyces sp. NPDC059248 TaxID=3346791 RepID=UPI003682B46E
MPTAPTSERPVLTPAMAYGPGAVDPAEITVLRTYLERVVASRPGPVHTNVAFTAAYLGYDTTGEGYGGCALDIDDFPSVTCGGTGAALPVGAFVRVQTGSEPLYAEIVYREGAARPDGATPTGATVPPDGPSGESRPRPSVADEAPDVRRELLVPDFTAFGTGLEVEARKADRLRAHAKWLTEDGHVLVHTRPTPGARRSGPDETAHFAAYLLASRRGDLLDPSVPVPLTRLAGGADPRQLRAALDGLLDTVAYALATSDSLRVWQGYALSRARVGEGLLRDGPLGRADLGTLANTLVRGPVPDGRRRHGRTGPKTLRTAVGPWLRTVAGAGDQLTGVGYAVAVCRANLAMGDVVRASDHGHFPETGVKVALDDAFESGGVWRSHHPGAGQSPGDRGTAAAGPASRLPDPDPDLGAPRVTGDDSRSVRWSFALRPAARHGARVPLPTSVVDGLRAAGAGPRSVRLELRHEGAPGPASVRVRQVWFAPGRDGAWGLTPVTWSDDVPPGLLIDAEWVRGGSRITLRTEPLDAPVVVDGRTIRHRYDPRVVTRDGVRGPGTWYGPGAVPELVLRAVRLCGLLTEDGHALLDRAALPRAVRVLELDDASPAPEHGRRVTGGERHRLWITPARLGPAADELIRDGVLYAATGSRDPDGEPRYPARPSDPPIPLIGYDPDPRPATVPPGGTDEAAGRGDATPHLVHGFVRRLPLGSAPSRRQREAYRAYCRDLGKADGTELPPGRTFVGPHYRGR